MTRREKMIREYVAPEEADLFGGLSVRAFNGLLNSGLDSREKIEIAWASVGEQGFLRIPNFGRKSVREVMDVFDLPQHERRISVWEYEAARRIVERYQRQLTADRAAEQSALKP